MRAGKLTAALVAAVCVLAARAARTHSHTHGHTRDRTHAVSGGVNPFVVTAQASGAYTLSLATWPAFTWSSSETAVVIDGVWTSSSNGKLAVSDFGNYTGSDAWGTFVAYTSTWSANGEPLLISAIRVYDAVPAVVFEQFFPAGVSVNGTYADRNGVSTVFPGLSRPQNGSSIGLMQWLGPFIDNGSSGPHFTTMGPSTSIATGLSAGPMVFFDQTGSQSVVFSALSNFMAGNVAQDASGNIQFGVFGSAASIPPGYRIESVAWWGLGINAAVTTWGDALLRRYSKPADRAQDDFTSNYLFYNTDHGAYYYYTTGQFPDYLSTLLAVEAEAQAKEIPYRGVLLDSWWYWKGIGDGVKNWTAMPTIFPNGPAGMRNLTATTGWKVIAHNRYWAADTDYAIQNGGTYRFYIDEPGSPAGGQMAVPLEQRFWIDLLVNSTREWGLTTYEQDWLYNELEGVDLLTSDPTAGRTWLLQMNAGADVAGVDIQLCMAYPRHLLQSVEMSQVTQVRASDDHVPGLSYNTLQWRMGYSSLFAAALAVMPFKDNFFSTLVEPGGSVGNSAENGPALQAAISVYSAGPVTPGDGVGFANAILINRACAATGRLLQPSRPATAIDAQIVNAVFPSSATANGEIYATYTAIDGWVWDHVLAAVVNSTFLMTSEDFASSRADLALRRGARVAAAPAAALQAPSVLSTVAYNTSTFDSSTTTVQPFDSAHPIQLNVCGENDFQLWHTAPVFSNGWAYLGELTKFVPVAAARTLSIAILASDLFVEVTGLAGEAVPLTFYNANTGNTTTVSCTLDAAGRATVAMPYAVCM